MIIKLTFKWNDSSNQVSVKSMCTSFIGARADIRTCKHSTLPCVRAVKSTTSELGYKISLMSNFWIHGNVAKIYATFSTVSTGQKTKCFNMGWVSAVSPVNQHAHQSNLTACLNISHWHCLANKEPEQSVSYSVPLKQLNSLFVIYCVRKKNIIMETKSIYIHLIEMYTIWTDGKLNSTEDCGVFIVICFRCNLTFQHRHKLIYYNMVATMSYSSFQLLSMPILLLHVINGVFSRNALLQGYGFC